VIFAAITIFVASQRVILKVSAYFFMTQSGNLWIHPPKVFLYMEFNNKMQVRCWVSFINCQFSKLPVAFHQLYSCYNGYYIQRKEDTCFINRTQ
jgi:hypothetical protein